MDGENHTAERIVDEVHASEGASCKDKDSLTCKMRANPWILSTLVLGIVVIVMIFANGVGGVTGNAISADAAGEKLLAFYSGAGADGLVLKDVKEVSGLYEVTFEFEGAEVPIFMTLDGNYAGSMNSLSASSSGGSGNNAPAKTEFTEEENQQIRELAQCAADAGFKVYAADWCGYCEGMKEDWGGDENVAPFWIRCSDSSRQPTENAALCDAEDIQGFPTLKLDGEVLRIARTFEGVAEATGCPVPDFI